MKRFMVLLTALLMGLMMLAAPASAGSKNSDIDLTWNAFGYTYHGYFQVNPNGLMHQWRADDSDILPGWHFTYQPVGEKWPAADCDIDDPKFDGSSRYDYTATGTVLDQVFEDGTSYWVCRYMP